MPFSWKKMKSKGISQLVNDHFRNSQKRRDGSSLVVETGFPTSLIDLFMKNREKMKKRSKKKRDSVIAGFPYPLRSPVVEVLPTTPSVHCYSPLQSSSPLPSGGVDVIVVVGEADGATVVPVAEKGHRVERGVDVKKIFYAFVVFWAVVLALGIKRLAGGVSLSTFLLFFLEYVGKHVFRLLKPFFQEKKGLRFTVQKVWRFLRLKDDKLDQKFRKDESLKPDSRFRFQDFVDLAEEIQFENRVMDDSCLKVRLGYREIESEEALEDEESAHEPAELTRKKSRAAKLKSQMKILVPRKLRSIRKEHRPENSRIVRQENTAIREEKVVDECENEEDSENHSRFSSISSEIYKEEDGVDAVCALSESSVPNDKAATTNREDEVAEKVEAGLSLRYLVLCSIVLIGLVFGRRFAVVLTLSWFLLLKLGETLPRLIKI